MDCNVLFVLEEGLPVDDDTFEDGAPKFSVPFPVLSEEA